MNQYSVQESYADSAVRTNMSLVFGWMAVALMLTAGAAYGVVSYAPLRNAITLNQWVLFGLLAAQLVLVVILSGFVQRLSYGTALVLFVAYSLLSGATLSSLFLVYTARSLVSTFIVTAGMFGAMAAYGALTKSDLTTLGSMGRMVLFGLIAALMVNLFLRSSVLDLITAIIGVVLFAGLTAFDVQRIQFVMRNMLADRASMQKIVLVGALVLYLDFLNMFLSMLRIMGSGRSQE